LTLTVGQTRTVRRLAIHPTNPQILLAATSAGLFRTSDAGATWTSLWNIHLRCRGRSRRREHRVCHDQSRAEVDQRRRQLSPVGANCAGARHNIEVAKSNPSTLYTLCTNGTIAEIVNAKPRGRDGGDRCDALRLLRQRAGGLPSIPTSSSSPASI
jgi:hypothetical protein